jgi:hypothetical protein
MLLVQGGGNLPLTSESRCSDGLTEIRRGTALAEVPPDITPLLLQPLLPTIVNQKALP